MYPLLPPVHVRDTLPLYPDDPARGRPRRGERPMSLRIGPVLHGPAPASRPVRRPLSVRLGTLLIRLGRRLGGDLPGVPGTGRKAGLRLVAEPR